MDSAFGAANGASHGRVVLRRCPGPDSLRRPLDFNDLEQDHYTTGIVEDGLRKRVERPVKASDEGRAGKARGTGSTERKEQAMTFNPYAEAHAKVEEVERDLNAVNLRIAYLDDFVVEHELLVKQRAALKEREAKLRAEHDKLVAQFAKR